MYGRAQAGAAGLPADGEGPTWLRELNLDPRLRVAASVGTRVVQERQEELMADAWQQAGAISEANAALRQAQLARELGTVLLERHLQRLSPEELLAVTGPAHGQLAMSPSTLDDELRRSRLPEAAVSSALRRLASPQGPLVRRAEPDSEGGPILVLRQPRPDGRGADPPGPAGMVVADDLPSPPPIVDDATSARPRFGPGSAARPPAARGDGDRPDAQSGWTHRPACGIGRTPSPP